MNEYYMFVELENGDVKCVNLSRNSKSLIDTKLNEYGNYKVVKYMWCNNDIITNKKRDRRY